MLVCHAFRYERTFDVVTIYANVTSSLLIMRNTYLKVNDVSKKFLNEY